MTRALSEDGIEIVGEAEDAATAVALIERRSPDVALVDLHMPGGGGLEIARDLAASGGRTAVLIYTADEDPLTVQAALAAGAAGYLLKMAPLREVVRAVRLLHRGESYVDPTLMRALLAGGEAEQTATLSQRETEVLQLLADGLTTQAVANELFLAPTTVRSYIETAMQKLGTHSRAAAVAAAMRVGLIS